MVTKILGLHAKPTPADAADFMPADQAKRNQCVRHTRPSRVWHGNVVSHAL